MAKSPAWQRKEGKSEKGGLNAKGRASYNAANPGKPGLKAPQPEGGPGSINHCALGIANMATKSKVNAAGNYTKPELRKRIVSQVKAAATQGTGAGQWSARKAQLVAKKYKAAGGGYRD